MSDVNQPQPPQSGEPGLPTPPVVPPAPPLPPAPPVAPAPPVYEQPPAYGQQPPVYSQQPLAYGQQPPVYGQQPPVYGQAQPPQQPYSGHAAYGQPYFGAPVAPKSPLLSIFSMVAGIVALLGSPVVFIPIIGGILGLFVPAAAVVLGFMGKSKEPAARGFWLTGLILGFVCIGFALLSFALWGAVFSVSNRYDY